MDRERGKTSWYPFVARAELLVENSNLHLTTRVCELSLSGCHLLLTDSMPPGISVFVKVYAWPHFFQARGTVYQWERGHGIGVTFDKIASDFTSAFEACLLEAEHNQLKNGN